MLTRSLCVIGALTGADYLLWTWSVDGGHDVVAMIAGLSLPPLCLALLCLLGARLLKALGRAASRPSRQTVLAATRTVAEAPRLRRRSHARRGVPGEGKRRSKRSSAKIAA